MKPKFTTIYKQDGQTWTIQVELPGNPMYQIMTQVEYDARPEVVYYIENDKSQLLKCDKDKNILI